MLMNPIKTTMVVSLLTLMPVAAMAQQHIKEAFDALLGTEGVELHATHKLEKDPETGAKESQLDWWEFTLPTSKRQLVKNIERAFEQDREQAYCVSTGSNSRGGEGEESLAVGNSNSRSYVVGEIKGSDYIYALFIDPDDPERIHRYAYVLEWKEKSDEILGRLAITYATTLKYRQGNSGARQQRQIILNGSWEATTGDNWLAQFNMYAKLFRQTPNSTSSSYYANYIYNLCKLEEANRLTNDEKKIVLEEIAKLMHMTNDEFTINIFNNAMKLIKL